MPPRPIFLPQNTGATTRCSGADLSFWGGALQPLSWITLSTSGFSTLDVAELMTPAMASAAQSLGKVRFNDNVDTLADCPMPPSVINRTEAEIRLQELEEVARSLGVDIPR